MGSGDFGVTVSFAGDGSVDGGSALFTIRHGSDVVVFDMTLATDDTLEDVFDLAERLFEPFGGSTV